MNKFLKLIESFQSNAYPAMVDDFGQHLGLSSQSITRLALGWAPIVQFKSRRLAIADGGLSPNGTQKEKQSA